MYETDKAKNPFPIISTTLGAGWGLEIQPDLFYVEEIPENIRIHLTGDLPNSTISIQRMRFPNEERHPVNSSGDAVICGELLFPLVKEKKIILENFGAYIEGNCWPLAITTLKYHWGRIIGIEVDWDPISKTSYMEFHRRAPPAEDVSAKLPIRIEMSFFDKYNQECQNTYEFQINTLTQARKNVLFEENTVACTITMIQNDGIKYGPDWHIRPHLELEKKIRLSNISDNIKIEDWYGSPSENILYVIEELHVRADSGLEWEENQIELSREKLLEFWKEEGCQLETLDIEFLSDYDDKTFPYVSMNSMGYNIHVLVKHNLRGTALNYFTNNAIIHVNHHPMCCEPLTMSINESDGIPEYWEQNQITNKIQEVIIHVKRPVDDANSHRIQIKGNPGRGAKQIEQIGELIFPNMILPIEHLTDVVQEAGYKFVCTFAVEPEPSCLRIAAICRVYDEDNFSNFHETCNFDDTRSDGTEGCGQRIENCICDHPDGPIRTKTWMTLEERILKKDCKFQKDKDRDIWYMGISQKRCNLLPALPCIIRVIILNVAVERFELKG